MSRIILTIVCALLSPSAAAEIYNGPMIDAHNHWTASRSAKKLLDLMKRHGVVATILMARRYGSPKDRADLPSNDLMTLKLRKTYPNKFFPLVGMQLPMLTNPNWNQPNEEMERLYRLTESKLESGQFHGIGEIIIRHYPYFNTRIPDGPAMNLRKNPNTRHMHRLAEIAAKHNRPLLIHMEGEPSLVTDLDKFLTKYPMVKVIWAHACGRIAPSQIEAMLTKHANLFCDLATMTNTPHGYGYSIGRHYPGRKGWPSAYKWTYLTEENGRFLPAMKQTIKRFPDRFLGVGMDNAHREISEMHYSSRARRFRELLGTLPLEVAEKLAFKNAVRLFRLDLPIPQKR